MGINVNPGEERRLKRPTFLYNGIFVIQGSVVIVRKVEGDSVEIEYRDREGLLHLIPNLRKEDLE